VSKKQDVEKARYWRGVIHEAARSGVSVREFCRRRDLHESQFYWWQRRLAAARQAPKGQKQAAAAASFALVSDEPTPANAGIELVLGDGRRLRISRGVDEATLRSVLAVMQGEGC
jgi:transposase-like protein